MTRETMLADLKDWDLARDAVFWGSSDIAAKRLAVLTQMSDKELEAEWCHYRRIYGPAQSEREA
jgi:hypothetical protein